MLETCGDAENQLALELSLSTKSLWRRRLWTLYGIAEVGLQWGWAGKVQLVPEILTISAFDVFASFGI